MQSSKKVCALARSFTLGVVLGHCARTVVLLNPALSIFTIYPTLSISIQKQFLERVRVKQRERERERERNAGKNIAYNIVGDRFSAIAPGVYTAIRRSHILVTFSKN